MSYPLKSIFYRALFLVAFSGALYCFFVMPGPLGIYYYSHPSYKRAYDKSQREYSVKINKQMVALSNKDYSGLNKNKIDLLISSPSLKSDYGVHRHKAKYFDPTVGNTIKWIELLPVKVLFFVFVGCIAIGLMTIALFALAISVMKFTLFAFFAVLTELTEFLDRKLNPPANRIIDSVYAKIASYVNGWIWKVKG
ncbi:MAG: hypothetical protein ACYCSQ_00835 [bacterium]